MIKKIYSLKGGITEWKKNMHYMKMKNSFAG